MVILKNHLDLKNKQLIFKSNLIEFGLSKVFFYDA